MLLTNFSVYFYFIREGSICKSVSPKHAFDYLIIAGSLRSFVLSQSMSGPLREKFQDRIFSLILAGYKSAKQINEKSVLKKYLLKVKEKQFLDKNIQGDFRRIRNHF